MNKRIRITIEDCKCCKMPPELEKIRDMGMIYFQMISSDSPTSASFIIEKIKLVDKVNGKDEEKIVPIFNGDSRSDLVLVKILTYVQAHLKDFSEAWILELKDGHFDLIEDYKNGTLAEGRKSFKTIMKEKYEKTKEEKSRIEEILKLSEKLLDLPQKSKELPGELKK